MKKKSLVRRWFGKICSSLGVSGYHRRVRFQDATIYEFERVPSGGGGVPDGDHVALGLGPRCAERRPRGGTQPCWSSMCTLLSAPSDASRSARCVNTFLSPLSEKDGKDEYAAEGHLDAVTRTQLLSEWGERKTIQAQLDREKTVLDKLQKARDETANSARDQRYMPTNMSEAVYLAAQDEAEAEAARRASARAKATSPKQRRGAASPGKSDTLASAISKARNARARR